MEEYKDITPRKTENEMYEKPEVTPCGNIFDITKGGGLLPGDTSFTLVSPGENS